MANFFRGRTLQSVQDDEAGLLAAALEAADACASVKDAIGNIEQALRRGADLLSEGGVLSDAVRLADVKDLRADFEAAMTDLVDTRHRFRLHVIAACCAEGMCAREIAEIWGFSRQRASALIQEARGLTPTPA